MSTVDDVGDAMVLLAVALRAPVGVADAIESVARGRAGQVRRDLTAVAAAYRWGLDGPAAWSFASPVWAPAGRALDLAARTGAAPGDLVLEAAARVRSEEAARREVAAGRAGTLLVLPLGLLLLPAFVCTAVIPVVIALSSRMLP